MSKELDKMLSHVRIVNNALQVVHANIQLHVEPVNSRVFIINVLSNTGKSKRLFEGDIQSVKSYLIGMYDVLTGNAYP